MKIAIISDTHDNLATLAKFLKFAKNNGITQLIHCGDVARGETLEYLAREFEGKIYLSEGNMDYGYQLEAMSKKLSNQVVFFKHFGQAQINGLKIGFGHHKEEALPRCDSAEYDFIFYGHTHKPWQETVNKTILANPGNLAGQFYKATFAVCDSDTKKLELKIVELLN